MRIKSSDSGILDEEHAILYRGICCSFLHFRILDYFFSIRLADMAIGNGSAVDLLLKSAV